MQVRMLTEADGRAIASWRYPGRDATYDVGEIVTSDQGHWAVVRHDQLVGYCCFGLEARVPGVASRRLSAREVVTSDRSRRSVSAHGTRSSTTRNGTGNEARRLSSSQPSRIARARMKSRTPTSR